MCEKEVAQNRKYYCSADCAKSADKTRYTMTCEHCEQEFTASKEIRFCSKKCASRFQRQKERSEEIFCESCGKGFRTRLKNQRFCSLRCAQDTTIPEAARTVKKEASPKPKSRRWKSNFSALAQSEIVQEKTKKIDYHRSEYADQIAAFLQHNTATVYVVSDRLQDSKWKIEDYDYEYKDGEDENDFYAKRISTGQHIKVDFTTAEESVAASKSRKKN